MVMVFGEITTKSKVNYEATVRETLKKIGYDAKVKTHTHISDLTARDGLHYVLSTVGVGTKHWSGYSAHC